MAPLCSSHPQRSQPQPHLTFYRHLRLLSGGHTFLREPLEDSCEVHRMLSQQHTGHGHLATEGPGPSPGFTLTEEYFLGLAARAGGTKCDRENFLLNSPTAATLGH